MKKIVRITVEYDDGSRVIQEMGQNKLAPRDYIPSLPDIFPQQYDYNSCPKCGIKLEGVMGYCCPHARCPTGLGGAWS